MNYVDCEESSTESFIHKDKIEIEDIGLINEKCNSIMQKLLAKQYDICECLSKNVKTSDYACRMLELMHYDLRTRFKEKSL